MNIEFFIVIEQDQHSFEETINTKIMDGYKILDDPTISIINTHPNSNSVTAKFERTFIQNMVKFEPMHAKVGTNKSNIQQTNNPGFKLLSILPGCPLRQITGNPLQDEINKSVNEGYLPFTKVILIETFKYHSEINKKGRVFEPEFYIGMIKENLWNHIFLAKEDLLINQPTVFRKSLQ